AVDARLAAAVAGGVAPDSDEAAKLVAEHRKVLSEFFPVSYAKHYLISRGYITDPRFTEYYERQQEGLAQWLADAIEHVAAANGRKRKMESRRKVQVADDLRGELCGHRPVLAAAFLPAGAGARRRDLESDTMLFDALSRDNARIAPGVVHLPSWLELEPQAAV